MTEYLPVILLINLISTLYMVGVIWMVQLVHYPLMAHVGTDNFVEYQTRHTKGMGAVVGPAMILEAFSSLFMVPILSGLSLWLGFCGVGLVFVIWFSTALLSVPCHMKLEKGFARATHSFLVNTNWIRTLAWTARGIVVVWILFLQLS